MSAHRPGRVAGKTVLITGAAGGLGEAMAVMMAREGARVAVTDIDGPRAEALAARVNAEIADAAFASRMDDMMINSIRKFAAVKKRVAKAPTSPASHHTHARGRDLASLTYCSCLCVHDRWAQ